MPDKAPIFDEIYADYLRRVAEIDVSARAEGLGIEVDGGAAVIPFLGKRHTVTAHAVAGPDGARPHHAICVILCKYLLMCPDAAPDRHALVTYKDFKDAMPYVQGFKNTAERPIARHFSGRAEALAERCAALGGEPFASEVSCQMAYAFDALPRVPVYLLFNDADDDFPADCKLLFRESAAAYLDMECIAMIGMALAEWLAAK